MRAFSCPSTTQPGPILVSISGSILASGEEVQISIKNHLHCFGHTITSKPASRTGSLLPSISGSFLPSVAALPLPANDVEGGEVEFDVVEASDTQTNQERILDGVARILVNLAEKPNEQEVRKSRWEERYQQKRLASYCCASVLAGVVLAFVGAVAAEKIAEPAYATTLEVEGDGYSHHIGLQSSSVHGIPSDGLVHPERGLRTTVKVFDKSEYLYTIIIQKDKK